MMASRRARQWMLASAWLAALLMMAVGCSVGGGAATPTVVPTPSPAPRPTAEPPAAVAAWYVAAQVQEPDAAVRVRADLTAAEIDALSRSFARRYPAVSIDWRRGADAELMQDTLIEARAGGGDWDIYIGDSAPTLKTARLALRWTPPEGRAVPVDLVDPEGAWYALAATYHVVQFNTDQVPPHVVPTSYEALQHPGYFGRIAMEDMNLVWLRGLDETRGREATTNLVQALAQQAVTFRRDARTLVAFVTAGQQAVAIDARLDVVERERRAGGKSSWIAYDPAIAQPLAMVVSAVTDRPNASRLVGNFLLSMDAQTILANAGRVPSRSDVDPEPQNLVHGIQPRIVLPPEGAAEREYRQLWSDLWGRR
jgi:ABC-type Fe3+ transport system substrate-binding protein